MKKPETVAADPGPQKHIISYTLNGIIMNSKLLKQLMIVSKRVFNIFIVQAISMQFILAGNLSGQSLKDVQVTMDVRNGTVISIFQTIEQQSDFTFSFTREVTADNTRIDVSLSGPLNTVLEYVARNTNYNFRRINNEIYVIPRSKRDEVEIIEDQLDKTISGKIFDSESGEPLVGATVRIKGTTIGSISDVDGSFTLLVPGDAESIIVSFVGYITQELAINDQTNFEVFLSQNVSALNEVVVVGYGSQAKDEFNGAVSKVESKVINQYSTANFEQSMVGRVAGVQVFSNGKNPGENSVIQIRGVNSLTAGTSPLIVVDGNPLSEGSSMSSVNTNDIESISILKGAASSAIYGSRASSGVIFITTKKGKKGGLQITYDGYVGVQQRIDKFELTDAYETAQFDYDSRQFGYLSGGTGRSASDDNATRDANGGGKRSRIPDYLQGYLDGRPGLTNTNWTDAVFRNAPQQSHYLNLTGGAEKSDYSISFGFLDQDNIIIDSDYKRFTNNVRFNSELSDKIRFGINTNISRTDANVTGERAWSSSRLGFRQQADPSYSIVLMQPYYPIYNTDGSFAIANQLNDNNENWDGPISENTIAQTLLTDYLREGIRAFGNTYLEFEPIENLTFKTLFGADFDTSTEEYFGPSTIGDYRTPVENNPAKGSRAELSRKNYIIENTLNYSKAFNAHTIEILAGYSYQQELFNQTYMESQDFADDNIRNLGGATTITSTFTASKWALESYFSRIQYDYDSRYSFSASWRRDGSSRFGSNKKYGNFSSLSGGWTLSNESFFPQSSILSFAKVRVSWGQTGNNQIGNYSAIATLNEDNYNVDGGLQSGLFINSAPNADLSWETNTALNYGLDLGFLEDRLQLTAEYYVTKTTDMLLSVPVPQQSGFSSSLQNIGELENKGFELELSGVGFRSGGLEIGFNTTFATTRNKVLALGKDQDQIIYNNLSTFITKIGHPIAQFYTYDIIGVYRDQSDIDNDPVTSLPGTEVGDYIVRDADGNGLIDANDRVMQGDYNPDFTYGFGINLRFKGFDLDAQFFGIEGRKVVDNMVYRSESGEGFFVPTKYYFDNYFNEGNPDGFFRRPDFSSFSSAGRLTRTSSLSVYDGDYFRLRSLQIGYTLPASIIDHLGIQSIRFYFTGNNLFNITNFRGYNADGIDTRGNNQQVLSRGMINSASPLTRFMALGVNIKF